MKIRKTLLAILAAALVGVMLLSACGGGSNDESSKGVNGPTVEAGYPDGIGPEDTAYPGP
jgi:hypothetical protein